MSPRSTTSSVLQKAATVKKATGTVAVKKSASTNGAAKKSVFSSVFGSRD